ncbi:unnamed protein product [Cyclocybe aegerita]|uniref:Enoyl reductase (ER) domain-containing protein n=1 Tax=Cyclocybe aegerita TaxID=1973307 RepID=A0A8S0WAP2_CYCAE|nr:unnamed protein product [Cyclocybe aegerita]
MKAARYYGPGDIKVEQIAEPEARAGQVKVKIAWNGICGSDLHAYLAQITKFPTLTEPNDLSGETLPITLGHEFSGTIVGIGDGVEGKFKLGQNVVIEPVVSCRKPECYSCSHGATNVCPSTNFIGIGGWGGGLSEYIAVDANLVHILPENVSLEIGAMIEPLAVAWHAMKRGNFQDGQSALILGAGPIGLFLLTILRAFGPTSTIVVSEPAQIRRNLASKHGATLVLDPLNPNNPVDAAVLKATNGVGVDVAFDATGVQAAVDTALLSVRPHGTFVNIAIWEQRPSLDMNLVVFREITVTGSAVYRGHHPELLEAVASGKLHGLDDLITRKIALENVVDQGFKALINEKDKQSIHYIQEVDYRSGVLTDWAVPLRDLATSKYEATLAFDPLNPVKSIVAALMKATKGVGIDIAFDIQAAVDPALMNVRPHDTNLRYEFGRLVRDYGFGQCCVLTSDSDHVGLLEAVAAGKLQGLEDVVDKGIKALINKKDKQLEIMQY